MVSRQRLSLIASIILIILALAFVLSSVCLTDGKTARAAYEDEIQIERVPYIDIVDGYSNAARGLWYYVYCSKDTKKLTYSFYNGVNESFTRELTLNYDPIEDNKNALLETYLNGTYTLVAEIDKGGEDEIIYTERELEVEMIDIMPPVLREWEEDFKFEGGKLAEYWISIADGGSTGARLTARSGINNVVVFVDTDGKADFTDPELKLTADDIRANEDFKVVKEWTDYSAKGANYQLYDSFRITDDGDYYVFCDDRVMNSQVVKLFKTNNSALYSVKINGIVTDITEAVDIAQTLVNEGGEYVSKKLLDELAGALNEMLMNFYKQEDEDVIRESYHRFRAAQTAVSTATYDFSINIANGELFNGVIAFSNFNSSVVSALFGEKVVIDINVVEYREDNSVFQTILNDVPLKRANRIILLKYSLTKDGEAVAPKDILSFDLRISQNYKDMKVAVLKDGKYEEIASRKGAEWLIFETLSGAENYYLIIYDKELNPLPPLLWLYITLGVLGILAISVAIGYYIIKLKKEKAIKSAAEVPQGDVEIIVVKRPIPANKSKKKKR